MKNLRTLCLGLTIGFAVLAGTSAAAADLLTFYQAAKAYDANYQAAKAQLEASLAQSEQAKAGLWPNIGLGASINRIHAQSDQIGAQRNYGNQDLGLNLSQPLYRPAAKASAKQGTKQAALAQAQFDTASQGLMMRVAQAYFEVLSAQDQLNFVQAQKTATAEQLAAAQLNFEIGTASITDSREAQARFDLVLAQEIAANNELRVKKLALAQISGEGMDVLQPLLVPLPLPELGHKTVDLWVAESELNQPLVRQARLALEIAELETQKAQAAGKPTLDLNVSSSMTHNNGNAASAMNSRSHNTAIGLNFKLPLFAGYAIQNRLKETLALEEKAQFDLTAAQRATAQATKEAFFEVESELGQIAALETAQVSSQSALEATKLGYQVGVRINMDVLNAETALFGVKAKLARARYNLLINQLKLRQASGTLFEADIQNMNALLQPVPPPQK